MKLLNKSALYFSLFFLLSLVVFSFSENAMAKKSLSKSKSSSNLTLTWYDGSVKRSVELVPDMVAEIPSYGKKSTGSKSLSSKVSVKSYDSSATEVKSNIGGIKLWRINNNSSKYTKQVNSGVLPEELKANHSPVFIDRSGRLRTLPGNIIVFFDKSWDEDEVSNWAKSRGLTIVKQLSKFNNIYIIESPAGIKSIELANSLMGVKGVISASPNWATEMVAK